MKFNLCKYGQDLIGEIFDNKERNIDVSDFYNAYICNEYKVFNKELLDSISNSKLSEEQAFFVAVLGLLEVDYDDPYIQEMMKKNRIGDVKCLDINKYLNNPYYKHIKCEETKIKDIKLHYLSYDKYEGFVYNDLISDKSFNEITPFGYFNEEFKFLAISKKDQIWMSITPHEIETMEQSVNEATGDVVVMGLGLGYYPYMISLKDDVKKITIIEKDKQVIEIFKKYLLPQFEHKEKIEIVEEDAFKFAKSMECSYCFCDLWHDAFDGLPLYHKFKKLEKEGIKYSYWIEDSIIALVRRLVIILMQEQYYNYVETNYTKEENYTDKIINEFYELTKDVEFTTYTQILDFLTKDNLIKLMIKAK